MNDFFKLLAALIAGYLLGSLNTSVIVGRIYGKDIREYGSGSAGLTNALRVLGKPAAAFVLAGDILKGVVACMAGLLIGVYFFSGDAGDCVSLYVAGVGAVIGHNWPIYFKFKGGRGALTALAVLITADWKMAIVCIIIFVTVIAITRYVSLGSLCASVAGMAISFTPFFGNTIFFNLFCVITASMIIVRHTANIKRLLSGTENKLSFKNKT